jgi:hypothetical protein
MPPDAASYLENGGAVDSSVGKVANHLGSGLVEAAFAVSGSEVSSEPGPDDVVASTRVAAAAHIGSFRIDALLFLHHWKSP